MLEDIIKTKKEELAGFLMPAEDRSTQPKSLQGALANPNRNLGLIAEVKKASPSKGIFRKTINPQHVGTSYESAGADAISVLTDKTYFQGSNENLIKVKTAVDVPVLRKDFIIDARQIEESRRIGADAILLIAAALDPGQLQEFYLQAYEQGLEALVEVHNARELNDVLSLFKPEILGINNRNLKTFETSLTTTEELLPMVPDDILVVSESGIQSGGDIQWLIDHHVNGALIGEALIKAGTPGDGIRELFGKARVL
ncbi:indole-3-glycerol phosphate synthase [Scopulibacillus darangshiensis]|uniref:Indole-3-glycerol phosphate synthase n=1 Tax=Scopulibacillus darangshiensis TaxID=442528 RepID=A0A4R2PB67_9BACL|nr:indole-3-glycerol phosphate synthase TrpC [Scopulibacillus darangshiensis]TCP31638.1 indole-3-glycerol phosphate synthase [Scopulibacillus darangshiensis]